eukprot:g17362.t1
MVPGIFLRYHSVPGHAVVRDDYDQQEYIAACWDINLCDFWEPEAEPHNSFASQKAEKPETDVYKQLRAERRFYFFFILVFFNHICCAIMGNQLCGSGEQKLREKLREEWEEEQRRQLQAELDEEARLAEEEIRRLEEAAAVATAAEAKLQAETQEKLQKDAYIRSLAAEEIQASLPLLRSSLNQVADSAEQLISGVTTTIYERIAAGNHSIEEAITNRIAELRDQCNKANKFLEESVKENTVRMDLNTASAENLKDEVARIHSKLASVRGRLSHLEDQQITVNASIDSVNEAIESWNENYANDEIASPALEKLTQECVDTKMLAMPSVAHECCFPVTDHSSDKIIALEVLVGDLRSECKRLSDEDESSKDQLGALRKIVMEHARKIVELTTADLVESEVSFLDDEQPEGEGANPNTAKHFKISSEAAINSSPGTPRGRGATGGGAAAGLGTTGGVAGLGGVGGGGHPHMSPGKDSASNPYESLFQEWGEHSELDPRVMPRITRHLDNTNEYQSIDWNVLNHVWAKPRTQFTIFDNQQSKNSQFPPTRAKNTLRIWKGQVFLWACAVLRCGGSRVGLGNQVITKSFQDGFGGELHLCQVENRDIASLMFSIEDGFQPHLNVLRDKVEELLQHTNRMDGMPIDLSEIKGVLRLKMADLPKDYEYKDFANCVRHMGITDSKRYDGENSHAKNKKGERDFLNELLVMFNILEPGKDNIENFSLHQKINQYFRQGGGANAGAIFSTTTGTRPTPAPDGGGVKDACPLGESCSHLSTTGICKKRHTRREYAVCLQRFEANHPEKYRKWKAEKEKRVAEKKKQAEGGASAGDKK